MITIVVYFFTIGLMVTLGILFSTGRGSSLIAGFNTLPDKKKAEYDMIALCKFMGKMMFALSFSVLLWLMCGMLDMSWLFYLGLALFMGLVIFMLLYINTGDHFKNV